MTDAPRPGPPLHQTVPATTWQIPVPAAGPHDVLTVELTADHRPDWPEAWWPLGQKTGGEAHPGILEVRFRQPSQGRAQVWVQAPVVVEARGLAVLSGGGDGAAAGTKEASGAGATRGGGSLDADGKKVASGVARTSGGGDSHATGSKTVRATQRTS